MEQSKPEFNLLLLLLLVISAIGSINWGLIGIWNFDVRPAKVGMFSRRQTY
jgi:uncharacterized membrane protein YuzA (DUF378 family)